MTAQQQNQEKELCNDSPPSKEPGSASYQAKENQLKHKQTTAQGQMKTPGILQNKDQKAMVSFALPTQEIGLKDEQNRAFIHRFDLQLETKRTNSKRECEKFITYFILLCLRLTKQPFYLHTYPSIELQGASKIFTEHIWWLTWKE